MLNPAAAAPSNNMLQGLAGLWPILLMFGVLWLFMIMPQQKQQKQRREMLSALKKGDKVVTIGGIHGEITEIDEDDAKIRIAEKVEIKVTRASIARVKGE